MAESWRLFIALELPPQIIETLRNIQEELIARCPQRTVRWVNPSTIHLTLKFLGDVPVLQRATIEHELKTAAETHTPFELETGNLGCFPDTRRPRVAWVDIKGERKSLATLRDSVEKHIAPLGYPTEDRPFSPHLTLGRIRRDASRSNVERFGKIIADHPALLRHVWRASELTLFRSELTPSGAIYTALNRVKLITPGPSIS